MGFIEYLRVGQERTEAGVGAKQDRPSAIFGARVIRFVCVTKDASAQGDELFMRYLFDQAHMSLSYFRNQYFKRTQMQHISIEIHFRPDRAGK